MAQRQRNQGKRTKIHKKNNFHAKTISRRYIKGLLCKWGILQEDWSKIASGRHLTRKRQFPYNRCNVSFASCHLVRNELEGLDHEEDSLSGPVCVHDAECGCAGRTFTPADSYDVGERVYNAGTVTLEKSEGSAQTVSTDQYVGEAGKDYTDEKVYTYNSYTPGINSSLNWDPLSWETNEDTDILNNVSSGFYTFVLNSEKNGYSVMPELAAEMPVDVTAEYVGQYGVKEGEGAKA